MNCHTYLNAATYRYTSEEWLYAIEGSYVIVSQEMRKSACQKLACGVDGDM